MNTTPRAHLALPVRNDLLPQLHLRGQAGAGSHEPAVAEDTLVEVSGAHPLHHQPGVVTYLLWMFGGEEEGGEGGRREEQVGGEIWERRQASREIGGEGGRKRRG